MITADGNVDLVMSQADRSPIPTAPVLFLVFNRPDITREVFQAIRRARPPRLYVAADGPRPDRPGEWERCESVREIATDVDWPCELHTLFRTTNLGCKMAVSGGISWFFGHEEEGIILEDDVLPDSTFFPFCEELLERYRFEPKVMMISGNCLLGEAKRPATSYYFSRYTHIWGWASWRRAWSHYDCDMSEWPRLKNSDFLLRLGNGARDYAVHWSGIFQAVYAGQIDTWDYQWLFSTMVRDGVSIAPGRNLVTNTGFGPDATHTTDGGDAMGRLPLESMDFPLNHPDTIESNAAADRWEDVRVFHSRVTLPQKIRRRFLQCRSIPGRLINLARRRGTSSVPAISGSVSNVRRRS